MYSQIVLDNFTGNVAINDVPRLPARLNFKSDYVDGGVRC